MKVSLTCNINFGYRNILKTEWLKGNIPELKHDFYDGSLLQRDTLTLEHLLPHSQGGKTTSSNLVLTNCQNNFRRGNKDIRDYINIDAARKYIEEARQIKLKGLENYANSIVSRLKSLGVKL